MRSVVVYCILVLLLPYGCEAKGSTRSSTTVYVQRNQAECGHSGKREKLVCMFDPLSPIDPGLSTFRSTGIEKFEAKAGPFYMGTEQLGAFDRTAMISVLHRWI
jgi:hypothetical protein